MRLSKSTLYFLLGCLILSSGIGRFTLNAYAASTNEESHTERKTTAFITMGKGGDQTQENSDLNNFSGEISRKSSLPKTGELQTACVSFAGTLLLLLLVIILTRRKKGEKNENSE